MKALLAAITIAILAGCSTRTDDGCTQADLQAAAAAGARDATAAASTPDKSYSRDSALIDIRARETRIREAGYGSAADAYAASAAEVLAQNGLIDSICPNSTPR